MTDENQILEPEEQVVPEADAEIQPDASTPADAATPADTAAPAAAESTVESEPEVEAVPVTADTVETVEEPPSTSFLKNRNLVIGLAIILASLLACFCLSSVGLGWSFFGRGEATSTPTPAPAATPTPIPTPVPTPEPGQPPTAVIDAPNNVIVGEEFTLDGSKSVGDSTIVDYIWDFGDGTGGKDSRVKHTYVREGEYIVTLTVTDKNELSSSSSLRITAAELQPPTAVIQAPQQADAGQPVTFDGNGSTGANPIVNYAWNFGDRNSGSGAVVEHVYNKPGQYTVILTVTDNTGLTGESQTDIIINELEQTPPMAVLAGPSQAVVGQDVTFDASESTPGNSPIVNYAWDFGNGETADGKNEVNVTTQYAAAGIYAVVLTVTDENGLSSTADAQIVAQASLEDTTWWQIPAQEPDPNITAEFSKGTVSGFAGCNDYSGGYTTDTPEATSGALTIQGLTATRKLCEENVTAQENQYLTAFESVTAFTITGDTLTLTYPGGVLTYEARRE